MKDLIEFLDGCRHSVKRTDKPVEVVMGNTTADTDSVCSAICLAYLWESEGTVIGIPLVNCDRQNFVLSRLSHGWLKRILCDDIASHLLFREEVDMTQENLRVTLVDHNVLDEAQAYLRPVVRRVIDHHDDKKTWLPGVNAETVDIAPVGSCCTLIAEMWRRAVGDRVIEKLPDTVRWLLLGAITVGAYVSGYSTMVNNIVWQIQEDCVSWKEGLVGTPGTKRPLAGSYRM
eukprot:GHVQ01000669.1.p1 GENE.GHVQ01000669.1~~GHVQ01000669.1.p1  ORF type:complete len:231 (+),score=16.98 GHVQ01000669.1:33-725(+)